MLAEDQKGDTASYVSSLMTEAEYIYPTIADGRINVLLTKAGTLGNTFAN